MRKALMILIALTIVVFVSTALQAQELLFGGTRQPFKLTRTPGGNLLLAESGTATNDGKVSMVTVWWRKIVLLDGLPSALSLEQTPNGPTVVVDAHRTIYIVMSEGDNLRRGTPPTSVPNPAGPGSPLFSSIIRARFDPVPDAIRTGFQLTPANLADLADGKEITLQNGAGEQVTLQVLTDFRDIVSEPIINARASNPFDAVLVGSLTAADLQEFGLQGQPLFEANFFARLNPDLPVGRRLQERSRIYVADSGMNMVVEVDVATGRHRTLTRFPPLQNPRFPTLGGPVTDAVPTGIFAREDGSLLVSILSGFPFVTGLGKVYSVNPATGAFTTYIEGLTTPTDVMEHAGATYVLEISSDLLAQTPGRLLRFATPTSAPTVVTAGLIGPTGIAYEPMRNEFIVSETFTGLIKRIKVP